MTTKKNILDDVELDFDNFDEEAGTASAAEALAPKFAWGGGVFGGQFPDGEQVRVRLDVPLREFNKVIALAGTEGVDATDQLHALLSAIGEEEKAELILGKGTVAAMAFAQKFFDVFNKVTKASLGK